jgi:predicted DNA-binding transcriptional regulator AlpA
MDKHNARQRTPVLPPGAMARGLSRLQAAEYVGFSAIKFDSLVADGRMPQPARIDRRKLWDRYALDRALDKLFTGDNASAEEEHVNPWDSVAA